MTVEEAIKMALDYEGKVYATYQEASDKAKDATAKKVFNTLADEEKGHITYLKERLGEWQKDGKLVVAKLGTAVPPKARIEEGIAKLKEKVKDQEPPIRELELELLQRALKVEEETSSFYKKMVSELSDDGQRLFERFVEIEEGHVAIVEAELDAVRGTGFWFDMMEFSLESY